MLLTPDLGELAPREAFSRVATPLQFTGVPSAEHGVPTSRLGHWRRSRAEPSPAHPRDSRVGSVGVFESVRLSSQPPMPGSCDARRKDLDLASAPQ